LGLNVPSQLLPANIGVSFTGGAGYSWFGNQSPELGGFPLPSYLNWQAGVTFSYKICCEGFICFELVARE